MVDVVDGPLKGRGGTVRYIMRGFVFVQTREVAENAGFICLQARHTKVRRRAAGLAPPAALGLDRQAGQRDRQPLLPAAVLEGPPCHCACPPTACLHVRRRCAAARAGARAAAWA
jgi:hypothetical protein